MEKIPIGISSCLLGEKVRFNGAHKRNAYIVNTLSEYFEFHTCCPEVEIGLGIPRPPIHLVRQHGTIRCLGVDAPENDVTERLRDHANSHQQLHAKLCGYIFKKGSPSCGIQHVRVFSNNIPQRIGIGIYARQLMTNNPLLPVEEEGQLSDPQLRENFIQRVNVFYRWKSLRFEGMNVKKLANFHARHKLIIMSHGDYHEFEQILANLKQVNMHAIAEQYILRLMRLLKKIASRQQHVYVLQYIQGYLKKELSRHEKAELYEIIDSYRNKEISLITPLTLLKHHFRKDPGSSFINNSYYMSPTPLEEQLINQL